MSGSDGGVLPMTFSARMTRLAFGIVLLWAVTHAVADFDSGMTAYRAGDYATAHDEWLPLAEQGSAAAQFNIGLLLRYAKGREANPRVAADWFQRAADTGFAPAQYELGEMYEAGEGVEQDVVQSYKWFKLAAEQKYDDAKKRRKKLGNRMTSSELALGEMWVREWKKDRKEDADD